MGPQAYQRNMTIRADTNALPFSGADVADLSYRTGVSRSQYSDLNEG